MLVFAVDYMIHLHQIATPDYDAPGRLRCRPGQECDRRGKRLIRRFTPRRAATWMVRVTEILGSCG
jgi:hypothetical protein